MSDSFEIIYKELAIPDEDTPSEVDLLKAIQERVLFLLENEPDLLMSYLYRLDIDEGKINAVLAKGPGGNVDSGLAQLILQRQKQRLETKKKYKQSPLNDWD